MGKVQIHKISGGGGDTLTPQKLFEGDCSIPAHTGASNVDMTGGAVSAETLENYDILMVKVEGTITATKTGSSDYDRWWAMFGKALNYSSSSKNCYPFDYVGSGSTGDEVCIIKSFSKMDHENWLTQVSSNLSYSREDLTSDPLIASIYAQSAEQAAGTFHVTIYGMKL